MSELPGKLVIVRHGESTWNAKGEWTGTRDKALSPKGKRDSRLVGKALKDLQFDVVFVSQQLRAKETLEEILEGSGKIVLEAHVSAALNERDYGIYTGMLKHEVEKHIGAQAYEDLRRGWSYPVTGGETLKDVYARTVPFYRYAVVPEVAAGKTVLLVAHGNSIRSLVKYIESISDTDIEGVEMIFGTALEYKLDDQGRMVSKHERHISK